MVCLCMFSADIFCPNIGTLLTLRNKNKMFLAQTKPPTVSVAGLASIWKTSYKFNLVETYFIIKSLRRQAFEV